MTQSTLNSLADGDGNFEHVQLILIIIITNY